MTAPTGRRRGRPPGPGWDEMRRTHEAIEQSACPQCGSGAGERCKAPSGNFANVPHQPRRVAAMAEGHWAPGGPA